MHKKRTPRDYKYIRLLGEGSFSSVYLAVDSDSTLKPPSASTLTTTTTTTTGTNTDRSIIRKYAIKVCQKAHIKRQGKQVAIMREKEIMNMLNQAPNSHFIKLFCTFQDIGRLFFVMSYAAHGDLLTYMQENPLSLDSVKKFTQQLIEALEHMHKLGIVHRDLKPENILLNHRKDIQISDFGSAQIYKTPFNMANISSVAPPQVPHSDDLSPTQKTNLNCKHDNNVPSKDLNNTTTTTLQAQEASGPCSIMQTHQERRNSFVGTAQYVSPEMLKYRQASNKSDLWALGIIIYQMHTNIMPFNAPNEYLVYQKIQNLDYKFTDNFDIDARDLVSSLVKLEPTERLGASDDIHNDGYVSLRGHIFLNSIVVGEDYECHQSDGLASTYSDSITLDHENDPDLRDIDNIEPGLDESQMLRLLTLG